MSPNAKPPKQARQEALERLAGILDEQEVALDEVARTLDRVALELRDLAGDVEAAGA